MTASKNRFIYSIIFLSLFVAFTPVILSNNYLRQDDLIMWQIWPGMKVSDAGFFYYNTVYQLVRPLCMLSFYLTDLISISIHNAVYVRLASVISLGILGILLYRWQLLFSHNRMLAAAFAICSFTLPPYQLFAATQNYSLVLLALLLTFGAMFYWYASYYEITDKKNSYFWFANLLFFASLLEYPLSSMYVWVMLCIYYLNILNSKDFVEKRKFFYFGSLTTLTMMLFYYIFIHYVHNIFSVNLNSRSSVIDTSHLLTRLLGILNIMSWHSNMWLWRDLTDWKNSPINAICLLFIIALSVLYIKLGVRIGRQFFKNVASTLAMTFVLFFLAFSPVMASPDGQSTFRYAIATMPLLLYIFFWSLNVIINALDKTVFGPLIPTIYSLLFISFTVFGMGYANLMLGDGIVGPHQLEFTYLQQQLQEKVIPLLKQHKKIVLHIIDCDENNALQFAPGVPTALEYSMRVCSVFQQEAISGVTHSLNLFGYASNYNRPNTVIWNDKEIIVRDIPWGDMIVNNVEDPHLGQLNYPTNHALTLVTIDFRKEPVYQHMQFYKQLFGIKF